jgi:hypothetical protein
MHDCKPFWRSELSFNAEQLAYAEGVLHKARCGDEESVTWLRSVILDVGVKAPVPDLLEIVDFTFDILRRQVRKDAERN